MGVDFFVVSRFLKLRLTTNNHDQNHFIIAVQLDMSSHGLMLKVKSGSCIVTMVCWGARPHHPWPGTDYSLLCSTDKVGACLQFNLLKFASGYSLLAESSSPLEVKEFWECSRALVRIKIATSQASGFFLGKWLFYPD